MTPRRFAPLAALALGSCVLPALEVSEDVPEPGEAGSIGSGGSSGSGNGGSGGKGGTSGKGGNGGGAGTGGESARAGAGGADMGGTSGSGSGTGGASAGTGGASGAGGGDAGTGGASAGMSGTGGNAGSGGTTVTCTSDLTDCGGSCRDLSSDRENCGECGMRCGGVLGCFDGACRCDPDAPDADDVTLCSDKCSVLSSDPENCGQCGIKCGVGELCEMGACVSDCTPAVAGPPMVELIDDLEDGDLITGNAFSDSIERGYWWFAHDETAGMVTPDPFVASAPGRDSNYAIAASGNGYTEWGSNIGFSLHSPSSISCPIDGSDFRGIGFAYRAEHPFKFRVSTADSIPRPMGTCPLGAPYCYATYHVEFEPSPDWVQVEVLWEELAVAPDAPPFDPTVLVTVSFDFAADAQFHVEIDDVTFVY